MSPLLYIIQMQSYHLRDRLANRYVAFWAVYDSFRVGVSPLRL